MKTYKVYVPVTALVVVYVESEEALTDDQAFEAAVEQDFLLITKNLGGSDAEVFEWSTNKQIIQGNVFCGVQNEFVVEETDD